MLPYSVLDLAPVPEGKTVADALHNTIDLARHAETWGYHRLWLAEHHNIASVASAATSVLIGQVAAATKTIRVGAGGIMLPNHAPLVVAEQFGTLATLFPGRIDLGLGRAPGTDGLTMRALRRSMASGDSFPQDVAELQGYFADETPESGVRAIPGQGTHVPLWILGSSLYGAQFAAHFGLPYAFASHFAPAALGEALDTYRAGFRPSAQLSRPHAMMAINVFAGESDEEGRYLMTSMQQAFANLHRGMPMPIPKPVERIEDHVDPALLRGVAQALAVSAIGSPATVRRELSAFIEAYRPDEVILTGQIHDHGKRLRSFEIAAEAMDAIGRKAPAA
ncbi:MAG: LLM class flavin-dependent oxidoreductase [Proteobacteria bacterium]|nr:LLM class flavin-dependent oxidoreductase [Pseudomonadota bacterium]